MTIFIGSTKKQATRILQYSAIELNNEQNCAFIISSIGTCFGLYKNEIMDLLFDEFIYKPKNENCDYINIFTNKLYNICKFEYRFFTNLNFKSKKQYEDFIKDSVF